MNSSTLYTSGAKIVLPDALASADFKKFPARLLGKTKM
jgi:hypothetical protein